MKTFKEYLEIIKINIDDRHIYEMANMQPEQTGLVPIIHVSNKGGAKHGPRVKVSNINGKYAHDDNFTVTAEHEPRIIGTNKLGTDHENDIKDWVKLNHGHIHKIWHSDGTMSGTEIDAGFRKL